MHVPDPNTPKVSDWMQGPPPLVGWWRCWVVKTMPPLTEERRRWWNGVEWSVACLVGSTDEEAEECRKRPAIIPMRLIHWCGLADKPDLTSYPYFAIRSDRTILHQAKSLQIKLQQR